jgi:hypothetical protein
VRALVRDRLRLPRESGNFPDSSFVPTALLRSVARTFFAVNEKVCSNFFNFVPTCSNDLEQHFAL